MTWRLKRVKQCEKCPWRKDANPREIPNGYCEAKHQGLESTIASGSAFQQLASQEVRVMACHETDDAYCLGWLVNQVGPGNNIAMRLRMMDCENADKITLVGEQHDTFEETLPE